MIRQLCRNIARIFGGQGGVRNLAVIFIIVAGLLLSCCFALVAVAGGNTPGQIAQATATPGGPIGQLNTPTPTYTPTPTSVIPSPTPTTSVAPTPTPTSPAAPTPRATTPAVPTPTPTSPPAPTPTQPSNTATPTLPTCNGTPTNGVPCKPPGTGGGPGVGPQSGIDNGGTLALILVALLSLVLVAGGVTAALRVRRVRSR